MIADTIDQGVLEPTSRAASVTDSASKRERVLVLTLDADDTDILCAALAERGIQAVGCPDMAQLCPEIANGAGAAIIAGEVLVKHAWSCLVQVLSQQPSWSDFPIIVLTDGEATMEAGWLVLRSLEPVGNAALLERPVTAPMLTSAVQVALRARRRQYAARDRLRESQRHEAACQRAEAQLRMVMESARDYAILSFDLSGRIATWSAGAEKIFGYKESEILGQPVALLFTPEDRARGVVEQELGKAAATGSATDERWHLCQDGSRFFASGMVRPMLDAQGNLCGFTKIARDVTAHKQAEENLHKEKSFSDAAINSLPGIFYLLDEQNQLLRWNKTLEQVTGYAGEEVARMQPLDFFTEETQPVIADKIKEAFTLGEATAEAELLTRPGTKIPYFFTSIRCFIEARPCLLGVGIDITERKRAEEILQAAKDQLSRHASELEQRVGERTRNLQASIQSLEGVLYHVAHDLRAPLRTMQGFTTILFEEHAPRLGAAGMDYAQRISLAATRMDRLIQDLLAYGRLAHRPLSQANLNLERHLANTLAALADDIRARNATVRVVQPLPEVRADPAILELILTQLLKNALTFVAPGVTPQIQMRAEPIAPGMVRVFVQDNGLGVAAEHHDRIFRVFERLQPEDVSPVTGIGLAIVRKGAERMGGAAGVESKLGDGSRFWVDVPAVPNNS